MDFYPILGDDATFGKCRASGRGGQAGKGGTNVALPQSEIRTLGYQLDPPFVSKSIPLWSRLCQFLMVQHVPVCACFFHFAEKNKNDYHPEHREFRYGENVCFVGLLWSAPSTCPRAALKLEGKWKVSLCLVLPPQAAAGCSTSGNFCWRATFRNNCAIWKKAVMGKGPCWAIFGISPSSRWRRRHRGKLVSDCAFVFVVFSLFKRTGSPVLSWLKDFGTLARNYWFSSLRLWNPKVPPFPWKLVSKGSMRNIQWAVFVAEYEM